MQPSEERTDSGLSVVRYSDRRAQPKRELSPIGSLLTKLVHWLDQQPEWHEIRKLPKPIRKNMERDILKRVFRDKRERDDR